MSEIKKNIETCRGEDVLAEVSALPQDPHFGSLVNEAFDPLKQQALHQAGYDGYSEVIAQHKPYTFASAIIQMKSNLLLLLRALWQFPFGSGTLRSLSDDASLRSLADDASLRSLADMWQHYITRLSGNETYGIPSRLSSLTDLPSAPLLLADRKISGADVADGMSLVRILADSSVYNDVTELIDNTHQWTYDRNSLAQFPNAKKVTLGCKDATVNIVSNNNVIEELNIDELETVPTANGSNLFNALTKLKHFRAPKLKQLSSGQSTNLSGLSECEDIDMPEMTSMWNGYGAYYMCNNPKMKWVNIPKFDTTQNVTAQAILCNNPELERVVMGKLVQFSMRSSLHNEVFYNCPKLIDLRIGEGTAISLDFSGWIPTLTNDNLATFLSNFRTYIALRLADNGSGLTLTLSQAVYDAIKDESHLFVFDEGTMTIYAYLTNIKHWTVTK